MMVGDLADHIKIFHLSKRRKRRRETLNVMKFDHVSRGLMRNNSPNKAVDSQTSQRADRKNLGGVPSSLPAIRSADLRDSPSEPNPAKIAYKKISS